MTSFKASFFLTRFFLLFVLFELNLLRYPLKKFNEVLVKNKVKTTISFKSRNLSQWNF